MTVLLSRAGRFVPLTLGLCLSLLLVACGDAPVPVVGASSSPPHMNAVRFAYSEIAPGSGIAVDTVFVTGARNNAAPALHVSERFAATDGLIAVVGHSNSAASLAAAPIYNDHEIVQLAPTTSAPAYSMAGPYSFRLVPPDDRQGAFLARVLEDSLADGARVALTYVNDDYGRALRGATVAALAADEGGPELVLDLPHLENLASAPDSMVAYLVGSVVASRPDAVLWLGRASALNAVLPDLRADLGSETEIYGGDGLNGARTLATSAAAWAGVCFVDFLDVNATATGRAWASRYRERYGVEPQGGEALAYDAMALVLAAVADGARSGQEVREYLVSLGRDRPPYEGVSGPIAFNEGRSVLRRYRLKRFDGGGPR